MSPFSELWPPPPPSSAESPCRSRHPQHLLRHPPPFLCCYLMVPSSFVMMLPSSSKSCQKLKKILFSSGRRANNWGQSPLFKVISMWNHLNQICACPSERFSHAFSSLRLRLQNKRPTSWFQVMGCFLQVDWLLLHSNKRSMVSLCREVIISYFANTLAVSRPWA